jgi:hypothetical protein
METMTNPDTTEWEKKVEKLLQIVWKHRHSEACEWECRTAKKVMQDFRSLLASYQELVERETMEKIRERIMPSVQKFITKVETGRAFSKETYTDMLEIRKYFDSITNPSEPNQDGR